MKPTPTPRLLCAIAALALAACDAPIIDPGASSPQPAATAPLTGTHASRTPPPIPTRHALGFRAAVTVGNDAFEGFYRYPAEERFWLPMQNDTAYYRDWFTSGDTYHNATADGETWSAQAVSPSGVTTSWASVTYHQTWNGQQDCFVTVNWTLCGATSIYIQWYMQSQCAEKGTWTMKFLHNGSVWYTGTFTIKPQVPPGKVPLFNQLADTTTHYANWCRGTGGQHRCDGRAGEIFYTVKQKGCALTSAAMVLGYHGVSVTPAALNDWLVDHNGYSGLSIIFPKVAEYARTVANVNVQYVGTLRSRNDNALSTSVCQYGPEVISVIGSTGNTAGHFVTATGRAFDLSTWLINDPAGGVARTLQYGHYANTYSGRRIFKGPEYTVVDPLNGLVFFLHSPGEMLITDGQGRRSGYDPATGNVYDEIPGAAYDSSAIADPEDPTDLTDATKEFEFMRAPASDYTVTVTGTGTGTYMLDLRAYNTSGGEGQSVFDSIPIAPGVVHTYRFAYDPSAAPGPIPITGAYAGGGQSANVNSFLSYSAPTEHSISLPAGSTSYPLVIFYGASTDPATFTATLNGVDVRSLFSPAPGGVNTVRLPLVSGRNVLLLSIRGSNGSRMPRDSDRFVFQVP